MPLIPNSNHTHKIKNYQSKTSQKFLSPKVIAFAEMLPFQASICALRKLDKDLG